MNVQFIGELVLLAVSHITCCIWLIILLHGWTF